MVIREANTRGLKYLKQLGFVTSVMGGLSIVSLFSAGFNIGWVEPLRSVVAQYLVISNTFRHVVEPYIVPLFDVLAEFLEIGIDFGPRWPDIFLLMIIYLGSRIKSYISSHNYIRAVAMIAVSGLLSTISAYFASSIELVSWLDVLVATAVPLLGFLAYDTVYAFVGATLDRGRTPWWQEFMRHISFSAPLLGVSLCLNSILSNVLVSNLGATPYQAFVIVFAIDYFFISVYWAYLSFRHAKKRESRLLGESVSERFWRSSATNVALNVGLVLFSAISFMLGNAGLQSAGKEASILLPQA